MTAMYSGYECPFCCNLPCTCGETYSTELTNGKMFVGGICVEVTDEGVRVTYPKTYLVRLDDGE